MLVNNAGCGLYGALEDVPLREAGYQFEVNLFGPGRLTRTCLSSGEIAFLPGYAEQNSFCRAFREWSGHTPDATRAERP